MVQTKTLLYRYRKQKTKPNTKQRGKRTKKNQSRKRIIKFIGGGDILDINSFLKTITQEKIKQIENTRDSRQIDSLEKIKEKYRNKNTPQLYDFIYQNNNEKKLIKIWDHGKKDPESITAGFHGIHIYVIIENTPTSKIFEIIGKFIRQ